MAARKTGPKKFPSGALVGSKGAAFQSDISPGGTATYTHGLGTRNIGITGAVTELDAYYYAPTGRSAVVNFGSPDTGITVSTDDNDIRFTNTTGWTLRVDATAFKL